MKTFVRNWFAVSGFLLEQALAALWEVEDMVEEVWH